MSRMAIEAAEAPDAVARFLDRNLVSLEALGSRLRAAPPPLAATSARGSSDHAAGYFKYLCEILLGVPVASLGASVVSVYGAKLKLPGALMLTISQSGQSPDIVAVQEEARRAGALAVAFVNAEDSPVARTADIVLPLCAGRETSVAATKSFIVSLVGAAALVAAWREDAALMKAIRSLPEALARAAEIEWPQLIEMATAAERLYVLGRGPALPIAAETALKFKETCAIHAEAYSLAEVMHGPLELLEPGFPALVYSPDDASRPSAMLAIEKLRATGAHVLAVEQGGLLQASCAKPLLAPILAIQTAYRAIEAAARRRGRDPDKPRHLHKVTKTV